jgi:plasmid stability protein
MATLNIRRLPEDVHAKLRVRAAKAGRSMEAEARMILAEAVEGKSLKPVDLADLRAFMLQLYGGKLPTWWMASSTSDGGKPGASSRSDPPR